ncbi:hypothetical protein [Bradyrhizobium liaoningense]|uniref:hypothetical protein n=1 Tax=Bradyrhizobium liaoningense TaxID=43992 RepID=UPI001BA99E55|nr:hypothetical protein [Bradyrhizobium liaoningense]MBR0719739.1 hypothetical protein [Bradyrhizobium liaoningense]
MALSAMTPEAEAAAPQAEAKARGRLPDLLGVAYLVVMAAAMAGWMWVLVWIAYSAFSWLVS